MHRKFLTGGENRNDFFTETDDNSVPELPTLVFHREFSIIAYYRHRRGRCSIPVIRFLLLAISG